MLNPFFSLAVIVFTTAFAFFYVAPLYGEVNAQRSDLQLLDKSVKDTEKIKDVISQTAKTMRSIDPLMIKRLEVFLPESIDSVRFVNNIQGVGVKNGLAISNIKIDDKHKDVKVGNAGASAVSGESAMLSQGVLKAPSSEKEEKYVTTKIAFDVIASYEGFRLLVDDLEKSLGLINIKSLSFQEYNNSSASASKLSRGSAPTPLYAFKVEIETYSLK